MSPTSGIDLVKEIVMGVDVVTKNIYSIAQMAKNSTITTIIVNSFKTNQALSKNQFIFVESKYPKYYINKLD